MREFVVKQSSLTCRYVFGGILPALPTPGNPVFARLCKDLRQFGLTADKVSIETPTIKLSDVRMTLVLLQGAVLVRLAYEYFELFVPEFTHQLERRVSEIGLIVRDNLEQVEALKGGPQVVIQSRSHLELRSADPERYLSEHLPRIDPMFTPEAFVINLLSPEGGLGSARVVVARSAMFSGSLFVDYEAQYSRIADATELVWRDELRSRLLALGLNQAD